MSKISDSPDPVQERKELIQQVIDRLISNPGYKAELLALNKKMPPLVEYKWPYEHFQIQHHVPEVIKLNPPQA